MISVFAADGVKISHHFGGGTYAKEARISAGMILTQHIHPHDHLSILASGTAVIHVDAINRTVHGPACINIAAGKEHAVSAITDIVWFCIHATDEVDAAVVDAKILGL